MRTEQAPKLVEVTRGHFNFNTGWHVALQCPVCGEPNLHQDRIEVFNPQGEAADEGTHVIVDGDKVSLDRRLTGNPSSERQGLRIHFWCENGETLPDEEGHSVALTIAQDQGTTYLSWEVTTWPPLLTDESQDEAQPA